MSETDASMTKKCVGTCKKVKTLDNFHVSKSGTFGRHNTCKACRSAKAKRNDFPRPLPGTMVYCNGCKIDHDESMFATNKSSSRGVQSYCKDWKSREQAARNSTLDGYMTKLNATAKNNADRRGISYQLSKKDLLEVYEKQKGLCSISGVKMTHIAETGVSDKVVHKNNISVDRIDSNGIYEINNIHLTTVHMNRICWDFNKEDFFKTCVLIADRYKKGLIKC